MCAAVGEGRRRSRQEAHREPQTFRRTVSRLEYFPVVYQVQREPPKNTTHLGGVLFAFPAAFTSRNGTNRILFCQTKKHQNATPLDMTFYSPIHYNILYITRRCPRNAYNGISYEIPIVNSFKMHKIIKYYKLRLQYLEQKSIIRFETIYLPVG